MSGPKITLYVDTVSPFGYEAYWLLRNDPVFSKVEIEYVPMFLGGVMKACGNTPPIDIKNKDQWINRERLRWAHLFSIPMTEEMPPAFPPNTLPIMRALCALTVLHPGTKGQEVLCKALDRLFEAYWVRGEKTTEKDVLAGILGEVVGREEADNVLAMAPSEGKKLLAENTDKALADGAFGLPWFVATNPKGDSETFWGVDHIAQVTQHLGIGTPKTGGWRAVL